MILAPNSSLSRRRGRPVDKEKKREHNVDCKVRWVFVCLYSNMFIHNHSIVWSDILRQQFENRL